MSEDQTNKTWRVVGVNLCDSDDLDIFAEEVTAAANSLEESGYRISNFHPIDGMGYVLIGKHVQQNKTLEVLGRLIGSNIDSVVVQPQDGPDLGYVADKDVNLLHGVLDDMINIPETEWGALIGERIKGHFIGSSAESLRLNIKYCTDLITKHCKLEKHAENEDKCYFIKVLTVTRTALEDKLKLQLQ